MSVGDQIYDLLKRLWPINRSITGKGVRDSLEILKEYIPDIKIFEIPTGTKVFDWIVPNEWNAREAWIEDPNGRRIVDFSENNLHLIGYSLPINKKISLDELQEHLFSLPNQPSAIPYITSYYEKRWGFCLRHHDRQNLVPGIYHVYIDTTIAPGFLTYGELVIPGETDKEIFISTYICHPSMANNELSGPCVATYLARWLLEKSFKRYTYRIVFIPETIGSITYLYQNMPYLKKHVIAGFNLTCIGDDRCYSYLPSRNGNTLSDQAAQHVLSHYAPDFKKYDYLQRGSDERQYCSPGVDLPIVSIMRSKYCEYPEYHTSLDDLTLVTPSGLYGGYSIMCKTIDAIECNTLPRVTYLCEPQLGRRGLYPTLSQKRTDLFSFKTVKIMMDCLAYCDGFHSLLDIAEIIKTPIWVLAPIYIKLRNEGLVPDL